MPVKIAIVGNMNNNGFSMMRYFRDLGHDAHLLLYANDGVASLAHFRPEDDTWDIARWSPYVHQIALLNSALAALNPPFSWLAQSLLWLSGKPQEARGLGRSFDRLAQEKALAGYDCYIGSGIAPAIFLNAGKRLDVFIPYATGVEFVGDPFFCSRLERMKWWKRIFYRQGQKHQRQGVLKTRYVLTAETTLTQDVCRQIGCAFQPLPVPIVYNGEKHDVSFLPSHLRPLLDRMQKSGFVFLTPSRQLWWNPGGFSDEDWYRDSKCSDWPFRGFARLLAVSARRDMLLVALEYGPDVEASKQLSQELGIADHVLWLPKMSRRDLMIFQHHADAIIGQFMAVDEMIWGGVGWEALSAHKPLIHSFRFAEGRYEQIFGHERPPVMAANSVDDVYEAMAKLSGDPVFCASVGRASGDWFNRYNGIGLAERWITLLTTEDSAVPGKMGGAEGDGT